MKITISGPPKSGKSRLAASIAKLLVGYGAKVNSPHQEATEINLAEFKNVPFEIAEESVAVTPFDKWLEQYCKDNPDSRGYAYPIVEAAWNAASKK